MSSRSIVKLTVLTKSGAEYEAEGLLSDASRFHRRFSRYLATGGAEFRLLHFNNLVFSADSVAAYFAERADGKPHIFPERKEKIVSS